MHTDEASSREKSSSCRTSRSRQLASRIHADVAATLSATDGCPIGDVNGCENFMH
jgi:hypothetical protein